MDLIRLNPTNQVRINSSLALYVTDGELNQFSTRWALMKERSLYCVRLYIVCHPSAFVVSIYESKQQRD